MARHGSRERTVRSFVKRGDVMDIPNLTILQQAGYDRFLQVEQKADSRNTEFGLESLLREIFPIESYDGTMHLEYISYELDPPRYTPDECRELRLTYGMPFRLRLRLGREHHPDLPEEDIYLGEFPSLSSTAPNG